MFGDPHTFAGEHRAQLEGYVHRYGPGMVIYWFGFAAHLDGFDSASAAARGAATGGGGGGGGSSAGSDLGVVVAAEFPAEILFPGAETPTELPLRLRCD